MPYPTPEDEDVDWIMTAILASILLVPLAVIAWIIHLALKNS